MDYNEFIENKNIKKIECGFDLIEDNKYMFDFQRFIVNKALKVGRYAIFADCGLGKTLMQLVWGNNVMLKTNKPVIIFAPLAVCQQTIKEGDKFEIVIQDYKYFSKDKPATVYITNYENIDNVNPDDFSGIILDESSIIKNFEGAFRNKLIDNYKNVKYKLCCTATPSPNDPMELGNHSEFLGVMNYNEMLAMFFIHDGGETQKWRLKGHSINDFYKFVSTWASMLATPKDIGFDDTDYKLPELIINNHIIETPKVNNGQLFNDAAINATDFNGELRRTVKQRAELVANIVNNSKENFIIWVKQNEEADIIRKMIPDSVEVRGNELPDIKSKKLLGFGNNEFRVLITKTKIAQFGLNYQNCHNQIFMSPDFSFEGTYQAIRRSYRFGQKDKVNIEIVTTDTMSNVIEIFRVKQNQFNEMRDKMSEYINHKSKDLVTSKVEYNKFETNDYKIYLGDCCECIKDIETKSIDFSIFSPPFADLYTYSDSIRDMGNSNSFNEFAIHFNFMVSELSRIIKDGRNVAVHCCDLPVRKGKEGYIGLRDFSGLILNAFQNNGFIYHSRVTIWKDPVIEMQRTKALGLLHKQLKKDSSMSRVGIPDYLMVFRKEGVNLSPIKNDKIPVDLWQKYASPIWYDINYSNTLQYTTARDNNDEKHICPLQLETIERAITLWSNEGDKVFTPFMGIGSECYQAIKMGRKGVGIELKQSYFDVAKNNLETLNLQSSLF